MLYPATTYITQLHALQTDLGTVMKELSSEACFKKAKEIAEAAAPLITGEIGRLQKAQVTLNPSDPAALRAKLAQLHTIIKDKEKNKFAEYITMLDSLINDCTS